MKIVCFGDSITGWRAREPYLHRFIKFSDLLQAMLDARLGVGEATVLNRGWAGDKTYADPEHDCPGATTRLRGDVLDERPDIAVVLIGGNDSQATPDDRLRTKRNLLEIFAAIRAAGIRALVMQYHSLPDPAKPDGAWRHLRAQNGLIAEAATAHGLPLLDMGEEMERAARVRPRAELVDEHDGVHLAPGGELVFAHAILAKFDALGWTRPQARAVGG
jgi:lysophospholipase L1-like esterase